MPEFDAEQQHLTQTYNTLQEIIAHLSSKMKKRSEAAAADKEALQGEVKHNFASEGEAQETYVDYAVLNNIIRDYNLEQTADSERLQAATKLSEQPYFARISIKLQSGKTKNIYIGLAGITDATCHRLVVDWRSPVAEVYYNQVMGQTSYEANGRIITVELMLRRQYKITRNKLHGYFDSDIAIEDSLLISALSEQRTEHMHAITATIQKEQNAVIRHTDCKALFVTGVAGSGKTSVLLQRIAYILYQQRKTLNANDVYLISPNTVFERYIENVLPSLGEKNPNTLTFAQFLQNHIPSYENVSNKPCSTSLLAKIDNVTENFSFAPSDFRDIEIKGVRLVAAAAIWRLVQKYSHIEAGPHMVALIREELISRLDARLAQLASEEGMQDRLLALPLNEQIELFAGPYNPQNEKEERECALTYLKKHYGCAYNLIERDEWLCISKMAKRLLGENNISATAWVYLKMAVSGLSCASARYVMVDEVQDYTPDALCVLMKFFRRAHFMFLGDPHQAINTNACKFSELVSAVEGACSNTEMCHLPTSYRSTPEITQLFASLLPAGEAGKINAVQRADTPPSIIQCEGVAEYKRTLLQKLENVRNNKGLCAIIVPWKHEIKKLESILGENMPQVIESSGKLPRQGSCVLTLALAKGLEFDNVIVPNANETLFNPGDEIAINRLYTTISRATKTITILSLGKMTPLLNNYSKQTS